MRLFQSLLVLIALIFTFSVQAAIQPYNLPSIDPLSIKDQLVANDEITIIDVRPLTEFEIGHIRGAISVDIPAFEKYLPKSKMETIVIYDEKGSSFKVEKLADKLKKLGFKEIKVLNGGLKVWTESKFPMVSG